MRRRALLAASGASGGGGTFFAEFYFDYCESNWGGVFCERAADEKGVACYNGAVKLLQEYGTPEGEVEIVYNPINYGFEVYIEGKIVNGIMKESGNIFLDTAGEYRFTKIYNDGSLSYAH